MSISAADYRPNDHYEFYVPLFKSYTEPSKKTGKPMWVLEGIASTENTDAQNEKIIQKGMDFRPFLTMGYINWNHNGQPSHVVGVPLEAGIIDHQGVPSFWVKARLWEDSEMAKSIWDLASHIAKNNADGGPERSLGWSVEGGVVARDPMNDSIITQSIVRHCALTHEPVNTDSFANIAKSFGIAKTMTMGGAGNPSNLPNGGLSESAGPLKTENLDDTITSVLLNGPRSFWTKTLGDDVLKSDDFDADRGVWKAGVGNGLMRYLITKGVAIPDAVKFVDAMRPNFS